SRVFAVVVLSQLAGLAFVAVLLPVLPGGYSPAALGWGMVAGLAGAAGLILFYWALATGMMSVVAPVTATVSAAFPALFGLASGERPQPATLAGVALALVAVALVSREQSGTATRTTMKPLVAALASGAGCGGFFILLDQAPADTGRWPRGGGRGAAVPGVVARCLGNP